MLMLFGNRTRVVIDIAFAPLLLHSRLQRLRLIPTDRSFPPWQAFIPFSSLSPFRLTPIPVRLTLQTLLNWVSSVLLSPVIMLCLYHETAAVVGDALGDLLDSEIFAPSTAVSSSREILCSSTSGHTSEPGSVRRLVRKTLALFGWSPSHNDENRNKSVPSSEQQGGGDHSNNEDYRRSDQTTAHTFASTSRTSPMQGTRGVEATSHTPLSPVSSVAQDENEENRDGATIRITSGSAETGTVNLEIALPTMHPRTDRDSESEAAPLAQRELARRRQQAVLYTPRPHRLTQLTAEPAQMLASHLTFQLTNLILFPLRAIVVQRVVAGFLNVTSMPPQGRRLWTGSGKPVPSPLDTKNGLLSALDLSNAGSIVRNVALCFACETAVGFILWGVDCALVTWLGRKYFNWGRL